MQIQWWVVSVNGRTIDEVPYTTDCDADYVKNSLINHDGYPNNIEVKLIQEAARVSVQSSQHQTT
jgi:hypothetical protein